jgi:hypothetical protein
MAFSAQAVDMSQWQQMANDPEAMQQAAEQMMKQMAEASECANAAGIEKMQAEGQAIQAQIQALCAEGDRRGAEKVAMDYSKKMINSAEYQELKKCGEKMMSYLPPEFMQEIEAQADEADSGEPARDICDM